MLEQLALRADTLRRIRDFFQRRGVLEVETPLLASSASLDPHLHPLTCSHPLDPQVSGTAERLYLQTSPELFMKRLLVAGSGSIYQLGKAFRGGEQGALHNPEFTMLEWYRVGWDHQQLMDEVDELVSGILGTPKAKRITYERAFQRRLSLDAHRASAAELREAAKAQGMDTPPPLADSDRDGWLQLLMSHFVEPHLGFHQPVFVVDYPASQASLAAVRQGDPPVAERFELFVRGVELANGYRELADPHEQRRRFAADLARREELALPPIPVDERFLEALDVGLPECAGVALGVDRLIMLAAGAQTLDEVLAFPFDQT